MNWLLNFSIAFEWVNVRIVTAISGACPKEQLELLDIQAVIRLEFIRVNT